MKNLTNNPALVAYCGLYCGACGSYLKERCPGCHDNVKAGWCKIRTCCMENKHSTCVDCREFTDVNDCRNFNNMFSKLMAVLFRSNRKACIEQIRGKGIDGHAQVMAGLGKQTLPR